MKQSLLATAAMLLVAVSANAEDLKVKDNWTAYRSTSKDGTPVCGMRTQSVSGFFYLKYYPGSAGLVGHIIKYSWHFPPYAKAIKVPLTIGVDRNPILSGDAVGYSDSINSDGRTYQMPIVQFHVPFEKVNGFLDDMSLANNMWFRFDQGSEQPWVLDMTGSAVVSIVFKGCATELMKLSNNATRPPATQPYDNAAPAQPRQEPQTQPYTKAEPAQPSGPPPAQGDFGGI